MRRKIGPRELDDCAGVGFRVNLRGVRPPRRSAALHKLRPVVRDFSFSAISFWGHLADFTGHRSKALGMCAVEQGCAAVSESRAGFHLELYFGD